MSEAPELGYDYDNLQSLCHDCHVAKTNADRRRRTGKPDDEDGDEFAVDMPPGL